MSYGAAHHMLRVLGRYGYVERIRQGSEFVAGLLDRVIGLLLKSLQERLAESAALRADLGFTDIFPVPVRPFCSRVASWQASAFCMPAVPGP